VSPPTLEPHPPERRKAGVDRRLRTTPFLSRFWLFGRRRHGTRGRRSTDRQDDVYVDRYSGYEWGLAISVVLLSMADLALTLTYLSLGGEERNPIMLAFLEHSEATFIAVKSLVTVLGALFLLIHVKFRRVRKALAGLVVAYVGLIVYHLVTWVPAVLKGV